MSYTAPLNDMLFDIRHLANIEEIAKLPGFEEAGFDTARAVLEECAKFNEGVVGPLNVTGDRNPSTWKDGEVSTTHDRGRQSLEHIHGRRTRCDARLRQGTQGRRPAQWEGRRCRGRKRGASKDR